MYARNHRVYSFMMGINEFEKKLLLKTRHKTQNNTPNWIDFNDMDQEDKTVPESDFVWLVGKHKTGLN